jgi:demethylmenaquinone methyltransferase/2-methoxy-6-polyprenyl-1,4-benzoquinol methylase
MPERDSAAVEAMFDRIARRYDMVNTVLSCGIDAHWRRRTARASGLGAGGRALDVACGSGKLSLELLRAVGPRGLVIGVDFSAEMLAVAGRRAPGPVYVRGDGLSLPFADGAFDAATVAFGLRNFAEPEMGLREMLRVLRGGGRALVLEFVPPGPGLVGGLYAPFLRHVLPRLGGLLSGQPSAYRYLSDTVTSYRTPDQLIALAAASGWRNPAVELLPPGAVALLTGTR